MLAQCIEHAKYEGFSDFLVDLHAVVNRIKRLDYSPLNLEPEHATKKWSA